MPALRGERNGPGTALTAHSGTVAFPGTMVALADALPSPGERHTMLQVIISPAKQMRVAQDAFAPRGIPPFPEATERLRRELLRIERDEGAAGLKALWRVNDKLLEQNIERLYEYVPMVDEAQLDDPAVARAVAPAVFSYVGIQYQSLAPEVLDLDGLAWLQDHLWVLSGFYGCARPFDAVQPYRLEMGAKLAVDGARDLYAFWGDRIARTIEDAGAAGPNEASTLSAAAHAPGAAVPTPAATAHAPDAIVNLASVEYAKAVLPHVAPSTQVVTCIFGEDVRAGKPVQRATASKIARGSMVRWMAEQRLERVEDLTRFAIGYRYAPELDREQRLKTGATERTLVFLRAEAGA